MFDFFSKMNTSKRLFHDYLPFLWIQNIYHFLTNDIQSSVMIKSIKLEFLFYFTFYTSINLIYGDFFIQVHSKLLQYFLICIVDFTMVHHFYYFKFKVIIIFLESQNDSSTIDILPGFFYILQFIFCRLPIFIINALYKLTSSKSTHIL